MTSAAAIIFALKPWKKITIGNKKEARGWLLYNKSRLNIYTNVYMDKSLQLLRAHFAMNLELASDWLPNFVPFKMSIFSKKTAFEIRVFVLTAKLRCTIMTDSDQRMRTTCQSPLKIFISRIQVKFILNSQTLFSGETRL